MLLLLAGWPVGGGAATPVSFNNQIQPILSENCYPCHGPDSASRKPKKHPLRLDREPFAFEPRDDGKPVILRNDPAHSEMMRRIKAADDDQMPPASERKTLKPGEIALLEAWISQGAHYEKHWSLIPPRRPPTPEAGLGWAKNPVDRFVARELERHGLKPNPAVEDARLFRRLSFDLTGLPPTPEELRAFLHDRSTGRYERAVDRMLASDASAEQFARLWLDAVRYADTQGIHHDHSRSIWPYRDWVIASYKANLPFDEFTVEQIAGDLLPAATLDQEIASGYNRLLPTTGEGGAIPEEYAAIYAKDRADTTAAVWLGLTTGCATCHDHKFDPISTKEFYSLTAFFRNSTVASMDNPSHGNTPPVLFVPKREDRARWTELEREIAAQKDLVQGRRREAEPAFTNWLARVPEHSAGPRPFLSLPLTEVAGPRLGVEQAEPIKWLAGEESHPGPFGTAPSIMGGGKVEKATPAFNRAGQASYGAFIYLEGKPNGAVLSRMDRSKAYRGWDLFLVEGRPAIHIVDQWPDAALKVVAKEALKPETWHHVMAVFDGSRPGASALGLYVDGHTVEVEVNNNSLGTNIVTDAPLRLGGRCDQEGISDALGNGKVFLQDFRFFSHALTQAEVAEVAAPGLARDLLAGPADQRTTERTNTVFDLFLSGFDEPNRELETKLAGLETQESQLRERGATTLVMEEKKDSQPTAFVLIRGNYSTKGAEVGAAIPEALPPMKPELPRNRLGLARWIASRENPLTARVTVNRLWGQLFGVGIVETTEDFGVMGARPVNQDLLDWLAVEFMDSGWDFRHMVKTMVMSAAYRQSERISPVKLEKDPLNRLCSRGPHLRLDAEELRDQALAASGLLVPAIGGPSVRPYQPEGIWEAVAMKDSNTRVYTQDHGDALYRRSLYTFWKRVAPPPSMEILNAPTREVFCTRRDRTDTPLQALVTLNDPQFVEAARQLAARALAAAGSFDGRLDQITEPLLARRLAADERATIRKLQQHALTTYQKDPAAAQSVLSVGESRPKQTLAAPELAAWTLVASEVMNLDESLTK